MANIWPSKNIKWDCYNRLPYSRYCNVEVKIFLSQWSIPDQLSINQLSSLGVYNCHLSPSKQNGQGIRKKPNRFLSLSYIAFSHSHSGHYYCLCIDHCSSKKMWSLTITIQLLPGDLVSYKSISTVWDSNKAVNYPTEFWNYFNCHACYRTIYN